MQRMQVQTIWIILCTKPNNAAFSIGIFIRFITISTEIRNILCVQYISNEFLPKKESHLQECIFLEKATTKSMPHSAAPKKYR